MRRWVIYSTHVLVATLAVHSFGQNPVAPGHKKGLRKPGNTISVRSDRHDLVEISTLARSYIAQVQDIAPNGVTSTASAVFLDDAGYAVTCFHVVKDNPNGQITVKVAYRSFIDLSHERFADANWWQSPATLIGADELNDIAILKLQLNPFSEQKRKLKSPPGMMSLDYQIASPFWRDALPTGGEIAILAGYPLGEPYGIVQQGFVASLAANLQPWFPVGAPKILVSIVANPGNSGGPVLNEAGEVIGLLEGGLPSPLGQSGIAVVVPAHYIISLAHKKNLIAETR